MIILNYVMRKKLHNERRKDEDIREWHTAGQIKRRRRKRRKQSPERTQRGGKIEVFSGARSNFWWGLFFSPAILEGLNRAKPLWDWWTCLAQAVDRWGYLIELPHQNNFAQNVDKLQIVYGIESRCCQWQSLDQ
jgi:hypothetical protein